MAHKLWELRGREIEQKSSRSRKVGVLGSWIGVMY